MGQLDGDFVLAKGDAIALFDFVRVAHDDADTVRELALGAGIDTGTVKLDDAINPLWLAVLDAAGKQRKLRALVLRIKVHANSQNPALQALLDQMLAEPVADAGPPLAAPPELAPAVAPAALGAPAAAAAAVPAGAPAAAPADAAAGAAANLSAAVAAVAAEVYSEGLLWKDMPFIGRESLRDSLQRMVPPGPRRSLLVMGDEGSGKTYTRQFLRYLRENGGAMQLRPIDMSLRAGEPVDERELASLVGDALLGKEPPTFDPTAQPETVVSRVRTWLSGALEDSTNPIWLVLDGFTPKTATAGAIQLVNELAQAAANGDLGPVHVIVLGYHGNPALAATALCEALAAPTREEVKEFFARAAVVLASEHLEDGALEQVVDRFDAKYGPLATTPISALGPSARAQALDLFGSPP